MEQYAPWARAERQPSDYCEDIADATGRTIATVYTEDACDPSPKEQKLFDMIVAAPEMLNALRQLRTEAWKSERTDLLEIIDPVLLKATGSVP